MDERTAILGILLVAALTVSSYFVITQGSTGMASTQSYVACCCNILTNDGSAVVQSQIQTYAPSCDQACAYYSDQGRVFAQQGFCGQ